MSRSSSSSARLAVSRQAGEAAGRTTTTVEGPRGRGAGARVAGALGGWLPERADPMANPSTSPTARVTAGASSSHAGGVRRCAWSRVAGRGSPAAAAGATAGAGSGWSGSNQSHSRCCWAGPASSKAAWSAWLGASRSDWGVPALRGTAAVLRPRVAGPHPCACVLPRAAWTCGSPTPCRLSSKTPASRGVPRRRSRGKHPGGAAGRGRGCGNSSPRLPAPRRAASRPHPHGAHAGLLDQGLGVARRKPSTVVMELVLLSPVSTHRACS